MNKIKSMLALLLCSGTLSFSLVAMSDNKKLDELNELTNKELNELNELTRCFNSQTLDIGERLSLKELIQQAEERLKGYRKLAQDYINQKTLSDLEEDERQMDLEAQKKPVLNEQDEDSYCEFIHNINQEALSDLEKEELAQKQKDRAVENIVKELLEQAGQNERAVEDMVKGFLDNEEPGQSEQAVEAMVKKLQEEKQRYLDTKQSELDKKALVLSPKQLLRKDKEKCDNSIEIFMESRIFKTLIAKFGEQNIVATDFYDLGGLAWLDLAIQRVPQGIAIEGKHLQTIPSLVFGLKSLRKLSLKNNSLKNISHLIGNLKNLKILDLSDNQLETLPEEIGNLKNLELLDLSENNFSEKEQERILNIFGFNSGIIKF